jgi:hypothetical protein
MSQTTPPNSGKNNAPVQGKRPQAPPEERFWQRYSPHHEFPLSSVTSIVLHGFFAMVLVFIVTKLFSPTAAEPLSLDAIEVDAGGGGNPDGIGDDRGDGVIPNGKVENADGKHPQNTLTPDQVVKNTQLAKPSPDAKIDVPVDSDRVIADDGGQPLENFLALKNSADKNKISGKVAGKGQGGPGAGGGKGHGHGTGAGDGIGAGTQKKISVRQKRMERWVMVFDTRDGRDYRDQLIALGAILAVPLEGRRGNGVYRVFRDLTRTPVEGKAEDIRPLNRIFWVDDQRNSVAKLSEALGIPEPPFIAAFFPKELEDNLREQERKETANCPEDDIEKTYFRVVPDGGGYVAHFDRIEMRR